MQKINHDYVMKRCSITNGTRGRHRDITEIEVDGGSHAVSIAITDNKNITPQCLYLTCQGAIELAKAILKELPVVYVLADDDIPKLTKMWDAGRENEARAVQQFLKDSAKGWTEDQKSTSPDSIHEQGSGTY